MQEDRRSLYPEQMVWFKNVSPKEAKPTNGFLLMNIMGCGLAFINWLVYSLLALELFTGLVVYVVCIMLCMTFVGFVHQFIIKPNDMILQITALSVAFVLGMMSYQLYF